MLLCAPRTERHAPESYRPFTTAGVYVPTVIPVSSTYGRVTPWVMSSGSQFRPAPPPVLSSATWARDVNEIRDFGGRANTKRSAEQTDIGQFWFVTGPQAWNPIARQLVTMKKLDIVDSARLFALVAIATDDAFIAVFEAKYHYNFWRPVTAIRNADLSDNPATQRDASWLPLGDTPMHPEYPCAHCITSIRRRGGAAVRVRKRYSGSLDDQRHGTRRDPTLETAAGLRGRGRGGAHLRRLPLSLLERGRQEMGRKIAELAVNTQLRSAQAVAEPRR